MSRNQIRIIVSVAAATTLAIITGCANPKVDDLAAANANTPNAPQQIEVRHNIQFADVPAPRVFKLRRNLCTSFQGSATRFGKVVYDGIWNTYNTSQWYLKEMKLSDWKLDKSEYPTDYHAKHYFSKGQETALVNIYRVNGNTRVEIMVNEDEAIKDQIKKEAIKRKAIDKAELNKTPVTVTTTTSAPAAQPAPAGNGPVTTETVPPLQ